MSRFVDDALQLLNAAENALQSGNPPADMAILITAQGGIRMVADSDWPLESLQRHHGARTAYRVTHEHEKVRIEGREGVRTCRFESEQAHRAGRNLLALNPNYSLLATLSPVPALAVAA